MKINIKQNIIIVLFIIIILYVLYYLINKNLSNFESSNKLSSVVIVGAARNIEDRLDKTFDVISMIAECFAKSYVIIYENDSNDKTLEKLENFKHQKEKVLDVKIISEKNIPGLRTHRLSYARNKLLDEALQKKTDYIVVLDLDSINHDLTKDAFMSSFNLDVNWAGVFANQSSKYYDLWALRSIDDWLQFDFLECNELKSDMDFCLHSRYKIIDKDTPPIEVVSAFGGLGIYKTQYLNNCHYYGGVNTKEVCEHVKFNEDIRKNKGKLYINPKMINSFTSNHN